MVTVEGRGWYQRGLNPMRRLLLRLRPRDLLRARERLRPRDLLRRPLDLLRVRFRDLLRVRLRDLVELRLLLRDFTVFRFPWFGRY